MRLIKNILTAAFALLLLLVGILLTVNNQQQVAIDLVFFQLPAQSIALWLVLSFLLGALLSLAIGLFAMVTMKARLGAARRKIQHAQQELDKLRTLNLQRS